MDFKGDHVCLPFFDEHPEWLDEARLVEIDGEPELLCSSDMIAAFFNWAADKGILEDPVGAANTLKSMRAEDDRRRGLLKGGAA